MLSGIKEIGKVGVRIACYSRRLTHDLFETRSVRIGARNVVSGGQACVSRRGGERELAGGTEASATVRQAGFAGAESACKVDGVMAMFGPKGAGHRLASWRQTARSQLDAKASGMAKA